MEEFKLKKGDIIVFLFFGLLALGGYLGVNQILSGHADQVVILSAGQVYGVYPLNQDRVITIEGQLGRNKVVIHQKEVFVEAADCRDQVCVKHKPISINNQSIICLPNQLVIEVRKNKEEGVDVIAN